MPLASLALCLSTAAWGRDLRLPPGRDELGEGLALTPWLRLQPFGRVVSFYTNNVLLEPNATREEDVVFLSTAGAQLEARGLNKSLRLSYAGTHQSYLRNGGLDTFEHRVRLSGQTTLDRFSGSLQASAARLVTPTDPLFSGQIRRWTAQASLDLRWRQNDWLGYRVIAAGDLLDFSQRSLDFFDQAGWGVNGFVSLQPLAPLTVLVGGGYRELRYIHGSATSPDLGLANASLGVDVDLPARLQAALRGGFERGWILEHNGNPAGTPTPLGALASGQLRWRPPLSKLHETAITLSAQHRATYSSKGPFLLLTSGDLRVSQELPADLLVYAGVGYELQRPRGASQLRSVSGLLGLAWAPWRYVELGLQVSYTARSSKDGDYEVLTAGGGVSLSY